MTFKDIEHGWLDFRMGATFEFADAEDLHCALERRETTGTVVLTA